MHIFVVEDEQTIRQELKVLLENAMYQVTAPDTFENIVGQVRENLIPEIKYMLGSVIIPLFYIILVFVSVVVTVLSVQQISDSAKYRFCYDILAKLCLYRTQIHQLILKQLTAYYLCLAVLAMVISGKMILFASKLFVCETGVPAFMGSFFLKSIMLFFGIYLVYFIVTYVGFKCNVEEKIKKIL